LLGVQKDFSLKLIRFNAEIVHPKFIPHEGELELILKEVEEEEKEQSKKVSLEIPLDELREIKYLGKELLIELNKWAATKKFKMMYSEGEKIEVTI